MRAIVMHQFGGPEVLAVETVKTPQPGPNEVRIRVEAAGVNPAEAYIRSGTYNFFKPELPYTPGFDAAGVIEAIGTAATPWQIGDRVYVSSMLERRQQGTYAEKFVCRADNIRHLPPHLTAAQGASVGVPLGAAWRAIHQCAQLKRGETVLVRGASGAVGLAAVQLATATGATVIGTAGSEAGAQLVKAAGAATCLHHDDINPPDQWHRQTGAAAPDVIIEMLANQNLMTDLAVLAMYGRIVIIGSRGELTFYPRIAMAKEAKIHGMALWNATPDEWAEMNDGIETALQDGLVSPQIERKFPLAQANHAHEMILDHQASGKVIINPQT